MDDNVSKQSSIDGGSARMAFGWISSRGTWGYPRIRELISVKIESIWDTERYGRWRRVVELSPVSVDGVVDGDDDNDDDAPNTDPVADAVGAGVDDDDDGVDDDTDGGVECSAAEPIVEVIFATYSPRMTLETRGR